MLAAAGVCLTRERGRAEEDKLKEWRACSRSDADWGECGGETKGKRKRERERTGMEGEEKDGKGKKGKKDKKDKEKEKSKAEGKEKGRKGRKKGEFKLGDDNDIVGIVLLEIQSAEDLPRLSNSAFCFMFPFTPL